MNSEDFTNFVEYLERLWETLLKTAGSKSGGLFDFSVDAWGLYGMAGPPRIDLEVTLQSVDPRGNPMEAVGKLEEFVRELRRQVHEASEAGKFNVRPISPQEAIQQRKELRNTA